jgi:hypothetical protein
MTYNPAYQTMQRGRDQYLKAGDPSGPVPMEPVKDRRLHGGLRAPQRARSRCSSRSCYMIMEIRAT